MSIGPRDIVGKWIASELVAYHIPLIVVVRTDLLYVVVVTTDAPAVETGGGRKRGAMIRIINNIGGPAAETVVDFCGESNRKAGWGRGSHAF